MNFLPLGPIRLNRVGVIRFPSRLIEESNGGVLAVCDELPLFEFELAMFHPRGAGRCGMKCL